MSLFIEVDGTAGNDQLKGSVDADVLEGGAGDDHLDGYGGKDELNGGAGKDRLLGQQGNDTLNGGSGNDKLFGGANDDVLDGGIGRDQLTGGAGDDTFVFGSGAQKDTIMDFQEGADLLDSSDHGSVNSMADLAISQNDADVVINHGGGDEITLRNVDILNIDVTDFIF